jgi:hypothetical protein
MPGIRQALLATMVCNKRIFLKFVHHHAHDTLTVKQFEHDGRLVTGLAPPGIFPILEPYEVWPVVRLIADIGDISKSVSYRYRKGMSDFNVNHESLLRFGLWH